MKSVRALLLHGLALSVVVLFSLSSLGDTPGKEKERPKDGPVSYYRDIRPLFQQHCQGCHQPAKPQGGFVMTSLPDLLKAGDHSIPGVVPGKPDKSMIVDQMTPTDGKRAPMPKGKEPLPADTVNLIKRWIAEGAKDDTPKSAVDAVDEKHPPVYKLPPVISTLAYSPDGKLLAVSGFHEVILHKSDGTGIVGRLIGLSERIQSLAFSPDGSSLAVVGGDPCRFGELQVWDVAKRKLKYSVSVTFDTLYGVSWSPDGSKIAFGCADNTIRAVDAATGKQVLFQGAHGDWVLGTSFSQDGEHIVSVSRDMSMKLTVVQTQRFVDNITSITPGALKGGLQALSMRPPAPVAPKGKPKMEKGVDGLDKVYDEVVVAGSDGVPRLYKIHRTVQRVIGDDANKIREFSPLPGRVFALQFNQDGSRFAAGSSLDGNGEVRVYQTNDAKMISRTEHLPAVYAVSYRPDGKELAVGGFDGKIRLINPEIGKVNKEIVAVPLSTDAAQAR
jgi:mono/diheme cytochrome c family protein